jgi:hypothetical protein
MEQLHKGPCRSLHLGGATCHQEHVAPDQRPVRHLEHCMSHHETVKGDMRAWACRSMHVCRATCIEHDVAPPAYQERHGRQSMSPHLVVRSDMSGGACRTTRFSGATWAVLAFCLGGMANLPPRIPHDPVTEHRPDADLHVGDVLAKRWLAAPSMFVPACQSLSRIPAGRLDYC